MAEPNQPSDATPLKSAPQQETGVSAMPPLSAPTSVASGAPPKPPAPPKAAVVPPTRRNFLWVAVLAFFGSWFATAWTTFTLSMIGMTLGTVRFMFPNVLSEPPSTFKAGEVTNYEENKVDDK